MVLAEGEFAAPAWEEIRALRNPAPQGLRRREVLQQVQRRKGQSVGEVLHAVRELRVDETGLEKEDVKHLDYGKNSCMHVF